LGSKVYFPFPKHLYFCNMLEKSEFTPIGVIAKPHGISGEIAIRLFPDMAIHDLYPSFIFIDIDNGLVPYRVSGYRYKSDDVLLVKLPLLHSEEKIRNFMEYTVYINPKEITESAASLNNLNVFTGYSVTDIKTGEIGVVDKIQDISGNPLFIINGTKGEVMIPVAEEFIIEINERDKTIRMDIPGGLLDLNAK
jgi:16S rRNA processing protein RimM